MNRETLTAIVRVLAAIGIFLLMLVFLRACFSPPALPERKPGDAAFQEGGVLPPGY